MFDDRSLTLGQHLHTDGFAAWMRNRGREGIRVFTTDTVIEKFGVEKDSYEAVPLAPISAYIAEHCDPKSTEHLIQLAQRPIPRVLEWGQVLVRMRSAPINRSGKAMHWRRFASRVLLISLF